MFWIVIRIWKSPWHDFNMKINKIKMVKKNKNWFSCEIEVLIELGATMVVPKFISKLWFEWGFILHSRIQSGASNLKFVRCTFILGRQLAEAWSQWTSGLSCCEWLQKIDQRIRVYSFRLRFMKMAESVTAISRHIESCSNPYEISWYHKIAHRCISNSCYYQVWNLRFPYFFLRFEESLILDMFH